MSNQACVHGGVANFAFPVGHCTCCRRLATVWPVTPVKASAHTRRAVKSPQEEMVRQMLLSSALQSQSHLAKCFFIKVCTARPHPRICRSCGDRTPRPKSQDREGSKSVAQTESEYTSEGTSLQISGWDCSETGPKTAFLDRFH